MDIKLPEGWIDPTEALGEDKTDLVGVDGNVFAIMGFTRRALRRAGNSQEVQDAYVEEVQSDDYNHALVASMAYLGY